MCRPCRAAYKQEHYAAHKARYVAQAQGRKRAVGEKRMRYLLEYFASHPCVDCGETDPLVLEFDHRASDKAFNIGHALPYRAWAAILAEIAKCDVVCANCHRRRTMRRGSHLRLRLAESGRRDSNPN